jgi:predicted glutamine amidotransferase
VKSRLFLAHIRASTGTAIQQTNCHPFRHREWLWMHNGSIRNFGIVKRDLLLAVDPALYPVIEGSTDSELMFYLALSLGLNDDPVAAVERMTGLVEESAERHGIANPLQMTVPTEKLCGCFGTQLSTSRDLCSTVRIFAPCGSFIRAMSG